jgi:hypothetical protein
MRPGTTRLAGLDRLRAVAVLVMVFHHLTDWLTGRARLLFGGTDHLAVTDIAAPAFFLVAGASVRLFADSRRGGAHAAVLRRYGLLLPIGMAMSGLLLDGWLSFGALEAIAVTTVAAHGVRTLVRRSRAVAALGAACLLANADVARWAQRYQEGAFAREVLDSSFPLLLYLGFVLLGMAAVPLLRVPGAARVALSLGAVLVGAALVWGEARGTGVRRYPGELPFAVLGLGGTLLTYGALARTSAGARLLTGAGAHALGIFWGHYLLRPVIQALGWYRDVPAPVAVTIAAAAAFGVAWLAPRVPQPPWTPRLGWRGGRGRKPLVAESSRGGGR